MRDSDAWYEGAIWTRAVLTCDLTVSFHEFLMCMRELAARRAYMDVMLERNHVADAMARAALARANIPANMATFQTEAHMTPRIPENVSSGWSNWTLVSNSPPPREPNDDDDDEAEEDEEDQDQDEEPPVVREPDE
jgi:hypothetical protein